MKNKNKITFGTNEEKEIMRFEANGDIYIKQKRITNDLEIVNAIKQFLKDTGYLKDEIK